MQQYRLRPFAAENLARTIAVGLTAAAIALLWGDVLLGAAAARQMQPPVVL